MRKTFDGTYYSRSNFDHIMEEGYKDYVKNLALLNENEVFFNSSPQHASWVMANIFEKATNYVKIYAESLTGDVSKDEEYQEGLKRFLQRGGKLQIILSSYDPNIVNNIALLINGKLSQVELRSYKKRLFFTHPDGKRQAINFCVADDIMYRLETDIERKLAQCNFNDKKISKKLSLRFDEINRNAETINI